MTSHPWRRGDFPLITFGGRTIKGMVVIASENSESLIVMFDGILGDGAGAYVGMMPIAWRDGRYEDLIRHEPVELAAG